MEVLNKRIVAAGPGSTTIGGTGAGAGAGAKGGSKGGDDREHKAIVSEVQALLHSVEADVGNATDPALKETAAVLSRRVSGLESGAGEADRKSLATDLHALVVRSGIAHGKVVAALKEELTQMEEHHRGLEADHSSRREHADKHADEADAVKEEMTRIVEGMDKLEEQRRALAEKHASESAPGATPV